MEPLRAIGSLEARVDHVDPRAQAEATAGQFEAILVRQLVGSLRQSATIGGDGGLFGDDLGADTYADWFDEHMAEHIGGSGQLGIRQAILDDIARAGQLPAVDAAPTPSEQARFAAHAASRGALLAVTSPRGGIDVTR